MAFINDGFSTTISFSLSPTVKFKEKTVTPPSLDGGGENETTTMRNTLWRTKQPKVLLSLGNMSFTASYDPEMYVDAVAMLNKNQLITVNFPDGSTLDFWGWLNDLTPNENVEGSQPTLNGTVMCSNQDNSGNEVAPVWTAA